MAKSVLRNFSANTKLVATPVCNQHKIAYCGVCAGELGISDYALQHMYHFAHCGVCPEDEKKPVAERKKLWRDFPGEKTPEMEKAYDEMVQKAALQQTASCGNCGECAACDELKMSKEKAKLQQKLKKKKDVPDVMECGDIAVATQRQKTLKKLAQFAQLRNDRSTVQELNKIAHLLQ